MDEVLPSDLHLHLVTPDSPSLGGKLARLDRRLSEEGARDVAIFGGGRAVGTPCEG